MAQPLRRVAFGLAKRHRVLGGADEVLNTLSLDQIYDWMAFGLTESKEWQEKYEDDQSMERDASLTDAERALNLKKALQGLRDIKTK